jgi:hypothetical protein
MERQYFNRSALLFFILLGLVCLLLVPYLAEKLFSDGVVKEMEDEQARAEKAEEWLREDPADTASTQGAKKIVWKWQDFDGGLHKISFEVNEESLAEVTRLREEMDFDGSNISGLYSNLHQNSKGIMKPMIAAMKEEIKKSGFPSDEVYMKSLEMVTSAVQYIPYTLVLDNSGTCPCELPFGSFSSDCQVQENGRGCCAGIIPFGVYAPAEFMNHKKGDCDTRSLFAYLLLKDMGFDVAVMISMQQGHSVLGVHLNNKSYPDYGSGPGGKKYYLWELTAKDMPLGRGVEGSDWKSALN